MQKHVYQSRSEVENKIKEIAIEIYFLKEDEYSKEKLMHWLLNRPASLGLGEMMMTTVVVDFCEALMHEFSIEEEIFEKFFNDLKTYTQLVDFICNVQEIK